MTDELAAVDEGAADAAPPQDTQPETNSGADDTHQVNSVNQSVKPVGQRSTLDFGKVDALRRHILMTSSDMAKILGVSRVTYYGWVKGNPMRASSEARTRATLVNIVKIVKEHQWPGPDILVLTQRDRAKRMLELLGHSD